MACSGHREQANHDNRVRPLAVVVIGLLAVSAAEAAFWFPNYLAYFNGLVAPSRAYRHLVDSSLDWGQELPAVQRYVERHQVDAPVYLAYFGTDSPDRYGVKARQIYGYMGHDLIAKPAFLLLSGLTQPQDNERISEFLRREPDYDPALVGTAQFDNGVATMLVKRSSALRLTGGTYLISATLLQPLNFTLAFGPWNSVHEATYQQLAASFRPLLADDRAARAAALGKLGAAEWQRLFPRYFEYRFARLTAYLRTREPDDTINYSILVYHLTDTEIARALDGPSP